MSLGSGAQLAHYLILELVGKGGMGEVYRARDTKLDRDVAIKVLPDEFARDGERLARFEREAKRLASLNHPNIASIYGIEESEGTKALVLEFIEGPRPRSGSNKVPFPSKRRSTSRSRSRGACAGRCDRSPQLHEILGNNSGFFSPAKIRA